MDMKRFFLYAIAIAALALAGCGGNGGGGDGGLDNGGPPPAETCPTGQTTPTPPDCVDSSSSDSADVCGRSHGCQLYGCDAGVN